MTGVFICEAQIALDGAGEEHAALRDIPDLVAQVALLHLADIHAVHEDGAFSHIKEARDEVDHGGLARTGGADDGGGFTRFGGEVDTAEHIFFSIRIAEGNILEFDHTFAFWVKRFGLLRIDDGGFHLQHISDTPA